MTKVCKASLRAFMRRPYSVKSSNGFVQIATSPIRRACISMGKTGSASCRSKRSTVCWFHANNALCGWRSSSGPLRIFRIAASASANSSGETISLGSSSSRTRCVNVGASWKSSLAATQASSTAATIRREISSSLVNPSASSIRCSAAFRSMW